MVFKGKCLCLAGVGIPKSKWVVGVISHKRQGRLFRSCLGELFRSVVLQAFTFHGKGDRFLSQAPFQIVVDSFSTRVDSPPSLHPCPDVTRIRRICLDCYWFFLVETKGFYPLNPQNQFSLFAEVSLQQPSCCRSPFFLFSSKGHPAHRSERIRKSSGSRDGERRHGAEMVDVHP